MIQGIKVLDIHSHFPNSGDWFPDYKQVSHHLSKQKEMKNRDRQNEIWRKAYNFPVRREEVTDDQEASDRWYRDIVEKEIEVVVFVSGGGNERLAHIVGATVDGWDPAQKALHGAFPGIMLAENALVALPSIFASSRTNNF